MPSSSPAGASTNNPGAPASVYTPTGQPQADQLYQQIIGGFPTSPGATPAGQNYGPAQTATYADIVNNPGYSILNSFAGYAPTGALASYDAATQLGSTLDTAGYNQIVNASNNPYLPQAYQGAGTAYNIGQNLAPQIGNQVAPGILSQIPGLQSAANQILQTGFDPQSALYQRTLDQVRNQVGASNAASGVGTSPYGASVGDSALSNFNIDWQNNLLNREATAGQAASGLQSTAAGLGQSGLALGSGAANLANLTGQMPSNVYTGNLASIAQALGAGGAAGQSGQNIYSQGLQNLLAGGGASYNVNNTQGGNVLTGLSNLTNLGNNQYQIPQQVLNDLQSYLGLGQAASQISGNLGAQGLQEQQNAFSGLGGALGLGSNALFGSGGIGGTGGLLGTGGAGLAGLFAPSAATSDLAIQSALPGLGDAALGGSAGFGAGSTAADLLPLAAVGGS